MVYRYIPSPACSDEAMTSAFTPSDVITGSSLRPAVHFTQPTDSRTSGVFGQQDIADAASRTARGAARLDTPGYVTSLWSRGQINHIRDVTGDLLMYWDCK